MSQMKKSQNSGPSLLLGAALCDACNDKGCSLRGWSAPVFILAHNGLTLTSGDLMLSSGFGMYQAHVCCPDIHASKTHNIEKERRKEQARSVVCHLSELQVAHVLTGP